VSEPDLPHNPMRLLVVEGDKTIAHFVEKRLTESYFAVDTASDGEEGLYLALHERYDLLILDIMLPKMDGIEIFKAIRAQGIDAPVIFLTAKGAERDIVQGMNMHENNLVARAARGALVTSPSQCRIQRTLLYLDALVEHSRH
jgi:DNA-binding response OmpR family regulator